MSAGSVVSLRSGETDLPVAGATVSLSGSSPSGSFSATYTANGAGQLVLDRDVLLSPSPFLQVTAAGFLTRSTILRSDEPNLSLWPTSSPTGLDEAFSSTITYSPSTCPAENTGSSVLWRLPSGIDTVDVVLGPSIQDPAVAAAHQDAIARLNAATGGVPRYHLTTAVSGELSFVADIAASDARCTGSEQIGAVASLEGVNGRITGGRITYCTVAAARSVGIVLHELGHTVGLYHSPGTADVMYCSSARAVQFSSRERLVMKLMRQRRAGNRWPDDDRQAATTLSHRGRRTRVLACR